MKKIRKLLLIDDDHINNIIFEKLSGFAGFAEEIVSFISAVDGLDYLKELQKNEEEPPNIIFLDIRMPIVNGWEFLERLSEFREAYFNNTSIYMLTSSSDQSDVNKAKNFAIVNDYLVKPMTIEALKKLQEKHQEQIIEGEK